MMRVLCLLLTLTIVPLAQAADLSDCVGIEADQERLRCYDELAMRSVSVAPEPVPAPTKAAPAPQPAPAPEPAPNTTATPEELFGKSEEAKSAAIAEAAGVEDVSSLTTAVTSVTRGPHGKITINLDNGQRWRQVRAERFDVSVGDDVVIKRAVFGSFTLQQKSGGRKTKVRRVD